MDLGKSYIKSSRRNHFRNDFRLSPGRNEKWLAMWIGENWREGAIWLNLSYPFIVFTYSRKAIEPLGQSKSDW